MAKGPLPLQEPYKYYKLFRRLDNRVINKPVGKGKRKITTPERKMVSHKLVEATSKCGPSANTKITCGSSGCRRKLCPSLKPYLYIDFVKA
jgi:hypothetical protein